MRTDVGMSVDVVSGRWTSLNWCFSWVFVLLVDVCLQRELHAPTATAYLDYPILNSSVPCGTDLLAMLGADHIFCQS